MHMRIVKIQRVLVSSLYMLKRETLREESRRAFYIFFSGRQRSGELIRARLFLDDKTGPRRASRGGGGGTQLL